MSTNIAEEYGQTLRKAHEYIKDSQVLSGRNLFYCILKIVLIIFRKGIIVIMRKEYFSHFGPSFPDLFCLSWYANSAASVGFRVS